MAFVSTSRPGLTGYDNTDLASGNADTELYLYRSGSDTLICVSCMPTGARPTGSKVKEGVWVAGKIPTAETELRFPHILSSEGDRLFFESFDPLSLRDTNGRQDVYEWEAVGVGTCAEGSLGFDESVEGCVNLISSGESPQDAELIDASLDGSDVFFKTSDSLDARDTGLLDIYDARIGGGFPDPPEPDAGCEGEACQSPPEGPNDPTPASSSFDGAGNVAGEPSRVSKPVPCRKGKVRRRGKCVAKHRKGKDNRKKVRAKNGRGSAR